MNWVVFYTGLTEPSKAAIPNLPPMTAALMPQYPGPWPMTAPLDKQSIRESKPLIIITVPFIAAYRQQCLDPMYLPVAPLDAQIIHGTRSMLTPVPTVSNVAAWRPQPLDPIYLPTPPLFGTLISERGPLFPPSVGGAIDIYKPYFISARQEDTRVIVRVAADQEFNLNLLTSSNPDAAGTNFVIKQVVSTVDTVDGGVAGYTNIAEMDCPWSAVGKLQIFNLTGSSINYAVDVRLYRKFH